MTEVQVKIDAYEGPLALLCNLIEKNEIDIYDIPIALVTTQYLQTIQSFEEQNMEVMSGFIVMASTLLEIKSKMLLPISKKGAESDEDEEDPRTALVQKLIEYKKYKEISSLFRNKEIGSSRMFFRTVEKAVLELVPQNAEVDLTKLLQGITLDVLYRTFQETLNRRELKTDKVRSGFNAVSRDLYTIEEKIEHIQHILILYNEVAFKDIFAYDAAKMEIVVTFLALLELVKTKKATIVQETVFGGIMIKNAA